MPKVKVRSSLEHVSGDTVKVLAGGDLPKGCCVLRGKLPCTYRMTHIALKVERFIWLDDNGKPNVVLEGYCKSHRPKVGEVVELPSWLSKEVNGKQAGSRVRRLEQAMSISISAEGGSVLHKMDRGRFHPEEQAGNWAKFVPTLCDKRLKVGIVPTPKEAKQLTVCTKCQEAASALASSMTEKE
jgi:hypothetical protein